MMDYFGGREMPEDDAFKVEVLKWGRALNHLQAAFISLQANVIEIQKEVIELKKKSTIARKQ